MVIPESAHKKGEQDGTRQESAGQMPDALQDAHVLCHWDRSRSGSGLLMQRLYEAPPRPEERFAGFQGDRWRGAAVAGERIVSVDE